MDANLVAPCGMNCHLCRAYGREKDPCAGCRKNDAPLSQYLNTCRIRNCEPVKTGDVRFCTECERYPCQDLRRMDVRYRTRYGMSVLENLEMIKSRGMNEFLKHERERWSCPQCGEILCVHKEACTSCGNVWR